MQKILKLSSIALLLFLADLHAQTNNPQLRISSVSSNSIQLDWNSNPGTNYQVLFTEIIDPFSLWLPAGNSVVATGTNTSLIGSTTNSPTDFYKLHVVTDATGLPTCRIFSPTNGATVSGIITVSVGAQDDSRLSAVTVYLDDLLVGTITAGDLNFGINTTHFTNGLHTLVARAQDNVGISYLGGTANNSVVANETYSMPITLDFQNSVRWIDAENLFETFVPIDVESDIFPADWTVFVKNESGTVVRTFSGSTTDGIIQTSWDGADNNDVQLPFNAQYKIEIVVGDVESQPDPEEGGGGSPPPSPMAMSVNQFGVTGYEIEEELPALPPIFFEKQDANLPPLPPLPTTYNQKTKAIKKTLPASKSFAGQSASSSSAQSGGGSASSRMWRESPWSSGKIILARQRYRTVLVGNTFNAGMGQMLNGVADLIEAASPEVGANRTVLNSTVFVCEANGDYTTLSNDLKRSEVRDFYYHGHSDGHAIGFSELTPTVGLREREIESGLGNIFVPPGAGNPPLYLTGKPFRFVFMDGCLTANGNLPEAFGIPKASTALYYDRNNKKARAFLGWKTTTQDSIANNNFQLWTKKFWEEWLNDPEYNMTLFNAIDAANTTYPGIQPALKQQIYGSTLLKWRD